IWPESYLLVVFLGAVGLSCFGALWAGYAVENTVDLVKMVALYFVIVNTVQEERQIRILMWLMVLGGLFPALGTLNHYAQGILEDGRASWIGIFANQNEVAFSLMILVPIAAHLASEVRAWKAILLWLIIGTYIAAIYVTFSRAGILGLFAV